MFPSSFRHKNKGRDKIFSYSCPVAILNILVPTYIGRLKLTFVSLNDLRVQINI